MEKFCLRLWIGPAHDRGLPFFSIETGDRRSLSFFCPPFFNPCLLRTRKKVSNSFQVCFFFRRGLSIHRREPILLHSWNINCTSVQGENRRARQEKLDFSRAVSKRIRYQFCALALLDGVLRSATKVRT